MTGPSRLGVLLHVILLALACDVALAAEMWQPVASDADGTSYAAPDTIMRYSGIRSMWQLRDNKSADNKSANGKAYASKLSLVEYDCAHEKLALVDEAFFSGKMSDGQLVDRAGTVLGTADKWIAIKAESSEEAMMGLACGKTCGAQASGGFSFGAGFFKAAMAKIKALAGFASSPPPAPEPSTATAAAQSRP